MLVLVLDLNTKRASIEAAYAALRSYVEQHIAVERHAEKSRQHTHVNRQTDKMKHALYTIF